MVRFRLKKEFSVSNINTDNTNESLNEDLVKDEVVSSDNTSDNVDFLNENDSVSVDTQVDLSANVDSESLSDASDKFSSASDSNLNWYIFGSYHISRSSDSVTE